MTDKLDAVVVKVDEMIAEWEEIRDESSKNMQDYSTAATFEGRYSEYKNAKKVLEGLQALKVIIEGDNS